MKKHILSIMVFCTALYANAQEYLHINSHWYENDIPVELIDSITYGELSHADKLPAIIAQDPNISIFCEALQLTHMSDSLFEVFDYDYWSEKDKFYLGLYDGDLCYALSTIKKGYTVFAETDSVYAAHGIHNIEDLKAYAANVYNEVYPKDAGITDPTDRRNSLNRFVSYHLLDRRATKSNLTATGISNDRSGAVKEKYNRNKIDIADWYETMMPHSLMKCSSPWLSGQETVFINRRGLRTLPVRDVFVEGAEIVNASNYNFQGVAVNGYYHYINDIIAYDKQTQEVVLDEQIIINNSTMSPEFFNNDMRINNPYPSMQNSGEILIPHNALKNIKVYDASTRLFYLFNWSWANLQTDEFLVLGAFDFAIKLPPVPAGTYELNMGYSTNTKRTISAFYLDGELCDTVDLRLLANYPEIGWVSDDYLETPEAIAQNDSLLFVNGYRKGLDYCYINSGGQRQTQRSSSGCLRRIITTFTTDGKTDHYLRFKNVNPADDGKSQFMMDYIELCPTHLLNEYK